MKAKIVLLPGDGIGPEVTAEAELLIMAVAASLRCKPGDAERVDRRCSDRCNG